MISPDTLMWLAALLTYPLLASDPRGSAWAFLLGADLAVGLIAFGEMVVRYA